MDELLNLVRREADRVSSIKQTPRSGLISSYDKKTHSIRVTLQPEGVETGWLPLARHAVGNGFGAAFGPNIGDQVMLLPAGSDGETHTVIGKFFNDVDKAPQVEAGEYLIQHQKGQKVFWDQDGNLTAKGAKNNTGVFDKDGNVVLTSDGSAKATLGTDGTVLFEDNAGGQIYIANGKVYLGKKNASLGVVLDGGVVSQTVFGVP